MTAWAFRVTTGVSWTRQAQVAHAAQTVTGEPSDGITSDRDDPTNLEPEQEPPENSAPPEVSKTFSPLLLLAETDNVSPGM